MYVVIRAFCGVIVDVERSDNPERDMWMGADEFSMREAGERENVCPRSPFQRT